MLVSIPHQLIMVSGKGGVGKTTLSCGFARQLGQHQPQANILLLSTDPAHSLGDVLHMAVDNEPRPLADVPNVRVRALDARTLLEEFRADYGHILELLVERGSFVAGEDLGPFWEMGWPGLDELMALLEIQRILRDREADRVVVDMAPSGHTLNLFALMDFLDTLLSSLDQFQEKHRYMTQTLAGKYQPDQADDFIQDMRRDLQAGRSLIQDPDRTACWVVGIAEPMSLMESQRFIEALDRLQIPFGGLALNRIRVQNGQVNPVQYRILEDFAPLAADRPMLWVPWQPEEPVGSRGLDALWQQVRSLATLPESGTLRPVTWPDPVPPPSRTFWRRGDGSLWWAARAAWAKPPSRRRLAGPWLNTTPNLPFASSPSIRPTPWAMPLANPSATTPSASAPICKGRRSAPPSCSTSFGKTTCGSWRISSAATTARWRACTWPMAQRHGGKLSPRRYRASTKCCR